MWGGAAVREKTLCSVNPGVTLPAVNNDNVSKVIATAMGAGAGATLKGGPVNAGEFSISSRLWLRVADRERAVEG